MQRDGHYPYQVPIDFFGNGGFRFAEMSHKGSLLCLPSGMHAWDVENVAQIDQLSLSSVLEQFRNIEVLMIGQGTEIAYFPAPLRDLFREHKIIVEAVSTGSAISTYNILLGEKRAVAAALISVGGGE